MIHGKVHNMSLLEEVNARVANKNAEMLAERIAAYDKIEGPRVGDYLDFAEPQRSRYEGRTASSFRIAHDWAIGSSPLAVAATLAASTLAWARCRIAVDSRRPSPRHDWRLQVSIARAASGSSARILLGPGAAFTLARSSASFAYFQKLAPNSQRTNSNIAEG
jgi:hypothetical protein